MWAGLQPDAAEQLVVLFAQGQQDGAGLGGQGLAQLGLVCALARDVVGLVVQPLAALGPR
jgi:hypothetical protein